MRHTLTQPRPQSINNSLRKATPDPKYPHPITTPCCQNHPEKQATHSLPHPSSQQSVYYCEKCSIMLASKGHNVMKLPRGSMSVRRGREGVKSEREREIEQFINQLSYSMEQLSRKYNESENILAVSEEHFNGLLNDITNYFRQIQDVLEIQKYLTYNAILSQRTALESNLRLLRESMQQQSEELRGIGNDIQNNMEAVQLVELPIYESIMGNYRAKLALAYEFNAIELSYLPRPTLRFPETPTILYSLADKIKPIPESLTTPETILIPHAFGKPSLSNRSNLSRQQSCENSRGRMNLNGQEIRHQKKSLTNLFSHKHTESTDKQLVFSFQSGEENQVHKALFGGSRETFHPQEMMLRESLSLTQIRENEEECDFNPKCRYAGLLQQTIPIPEEAMMSSQQSIAGYLANTLNYSGRERGEETETLLIC